MNNFQKAAGVLTWLAKRRAGWEQGMNALRNAGKYGNLTGPITSKTIFNRAQQSGLEAAYDAAGNPEMLGKIMNQGAKVTGDMLEKVKGLAAERASKAMNKGIAYGAGAGALLGGAVAYKRGKRNGETAAIQQAFSPYATEKVAELLKKKDFSKEAAFNIGEFAGKLLEGGSKSVKQKVGLMGKTMFNSNALVGSNAAKGALGGAAVGAGAGLVSGDDASGVMGKALGGAALGAGAGAGYGKYLGKQYQRKAWMTAGGAVGLGAAGYGAKKFMGTETGKALINKATNSEVGQKIVNSDSVKWLKTQAGELKNTFNTTKKKTGDLVQAGVDTLNSAKDKVTYKLKGKLGLNVNPHAGLTGSQRDIYIHNRAKNIKNIRKQRAK